jgi:hypothetical protein
MKVGILTFHRALNYGAALQAYALRKTITDFGHECEVIDYGSVGQIKRLSFSFLGWKQFLSSVLIFCFNILNADIRYLKFRRFRREYIKVSFKRYKTKDDLKDAALMYDVFCTGSDQVWNPLITDKDFSFLLDFVNKPQKKFSYAASFGMPDLPETIREKYSLLIRDLNPVSVRETSGQKLIKDFANIEAKVTIDPTLLLPKEHWARIAKPGKMKKPYILCYVIMADPPGFVKFCNHLRYATGHAIVRIQNPVRELNNSFESIKTAGPLDFLGLVMNASVIVTNSFHGTTMAIIFEKPFYTFLYNNERDLRLKEITGNLDLTDRLISNPNRLPDLNDIFIDYTRVRKNLQIQKSESLSFIRNALSIDLV